MSKLNFERLRFMNKRSDYDGSDLPRTGSYADRLRYMRSESTPSPQHVSTQVKAAWQSTSEALRTTPQLATAKHELRMHYKSISTRTVKLSEEQWELRIAELRRLIGFILSREGGKEVYALIRNLESVIGRALCAHSLSRQRMDARASGYQLGGSV